MRRLRWPHSPKEPTPYADGAAARLKRRPPSQNPYVKDSPQWRSWLNGYQSIDESTLNPTDTLRPSWAKKEDA